MRRFLTLAALIFVACAGVGCGGRGSSPEAELARGRQLLRAEQFGPVLSSVDDWIRSADGRGDRPAQLRFRLMKAEALLGYETSARDVLALLTGPGAVPDGGEWAADHAQWLILRARALHLLGRDDEAPALLDRAAQDAAQAHRDDLANEVELRRGNLLRYKGRFADARRLYDHVLAESRLQRDSRMEARTEDTLGVLLIAQSRFDEAISELERGRALAATIEAADTEARLKGNLGICYFRLGDYDNARAWFDGAISGFSGTGNLYELQIWTGNAANVAYETGELEGAFNSYQLALKVARQVESPIWTGRWLNNLASTAILRQDWESAEKYNEEGRRLKRETNDAAHEASSLMNAGQIAFGRGDLDRAQHLFEDALQKDSDDPATVLEAHSGLAGINSRQGKALQAEAEFRSTIARIEDRQSRLFKDEYRLSWLDSLIRFYQRYVDFLVLQKQPDRALEAAESSRSKVLTSQPIRPLAASGYRELARRTGAVLLEYWLGPEHSYLWVVTPNQIFCHGLPPKSKLLPLIRSYRAVVTGGRNPLDVASDTGLRLYNALLAPAIQDAGSATRFIVVPDGELHSLNFETLPDGDNSNRFWIDRATIRISPSLNYLAANPARPRSAGAPKLLLIGDPVQALPQYPHLEFARQEIRTVAEEMSAARPVVVEGAEATPASYAEHQPGDFAFIHFSAHAAAAARRESALDSAVILSGPPDKCRLVARDVLAIPLNAELVTVSACRSAGGKTYGGEGLVGFSWAFMKAGASNVIAGLWDVNDRSTLLLMSGLYSGLAKGVPVDEALRSSKLALIHGGGSYARPFYWAPFQVYTARP